MCFSYCTDFFVDNKIIYLFSISVSISERLKENFFNFLSSVKGISYTLTTQSSIKYFQKIIKKKRDL